jgi:hypothetical protein
MRAALTVSCLALTVVYVALTVLHLHLTVLYPALTVLYLALTGLYLALTVLFVPRCSTSGSARREFRAGDPQEVPVIRRGDVHHFPRDAYSPGCESLQTGIYDEHSGSTKITAHLDHISHC